MNIDITTKQCAVHGLSLKDHFIHLKRAYELELDECSDQKMKTDPKIGPIIAKIQQPNIGANNNVIIQGGGGGGRGGEVFPMY